jgi:predicted lipoprotein with Yx(FWY)xxD motif
VILAVLAVAGALVQVHPSAYGKVLFDGRGYVLYSFTKDPNGRSVCTRKCAAAWPPYIVSRKPRAAKLGTTRRADGRLQLTYKGRPLYYYVGDRKPGQILCNDVDEFGGTWLVVHP